MSEPRILILVAHPELRHSRVNRRLMAAAETLALQAGDRIRVHDLYAAYPDYTIDVPREQAQAAAADLVVWQHPIYWYSMPALMKLWLDEVLARGWAYGGGAALHGRHLWPVLSTGGPAEAYGPGGYNKLPFDTFLAPYRQTAALCGMRYVEPLVLHGAHAADEARLAQHTQTYVSGLERFPHGIEAGAAGTDCVVPATDRPPVVSP